MTELIEHPLHRAWKMYLHYPLYTSSYGSAAYQDISHFESVEEFWATYSGVPAPSLLFASDKRPRVKVGGRTLEGLGLFQEGVVPEWERTPEGCHLELGAITDVHLLDGLWETLCLAVIGENSQDSPSIVGIRVVDKSKTRKPLYRLEVWLSRQDELLKESVIQDVERAFKEDGHTADHLQYKWKNHPGSI